VYHQQIAPSLCTEESNTAVHGVYTERHHTDFTTRINSEGISLYQDIWMQNISMTVLYYNNLNTILIKKIVIVYFAI